MLFGGFDLLNRMNFGCRNDWQEVNNCRILCFYQTQRRKSRRHETSCTRPVYIPPFPLACPYHPDAPPFSSQGLTDNIKVRSGAGNLLTCCLCCRATGQGLHYQSAAMHSRFNCVLIEKDRTSARQMHIGGACVCVSHACTCVHTHSKYENRFIKALIEMW